MQLIMGKDFGGIWDDAPEAPVYDAPEMQNFTPK
jgi:hypothetical protein